MSPCSEERTQLLGSAHEHSFSYDNDPRPGQRSLCCSCGTYLNEHAPDHPYGGQAGPNGMYARWCLRDDCDWRGTTKPQKDAGLSTVDALLLGLIVIPLLLLAFVVGGQDVICGHGGQQAYCETSR